MEDSDIAVLFIVREIWKLASSVHWLDESGEHLFEKCRWHTAWGGEETGRIVASFAAIINFDSKIYSNAR